MNSSLRAPIIRWCTVIPVIVSLFSPGPAVAADKTWDGGGADDNWLTGANWNADAAPAAGDSLFFTGATRLTPVNDFPGGTLFHNLTFQNPAGAFVLTGNQVLIDGGITNVQPGIVETIDLPLAYSSLSGLNFFVGNRGTLIVSGEISGFGFNGFTKLGLGNLLLSASNSYIGGQTIAAGTVTADFTQPTSPVDGIIGGPLTLGGVSENPGTNFSAVVIVGKDDTTNSVTFTGTELRPGSSSVRAIDGAGAGRVNVQLGFLFHETGGLLTVIDPTGVSSNLSAQMPIPINPDRILGGWATIGGGSNLFGAPIATNFASFDNSGTLFNYRGYYVYPSGQMLHGNVNEITNLLIDATSTGDVLVDVDGAGTTTDVRTINIRRWEFGPGAPFSLAIGSNNTLRLGGYGAIFKSDLTPNVLWTIGESTNGLSGVQNVGTLTAGGAPDAAGEIVFHINSTSESSGPLSVESQIADNGAGVVSVVKAGPGPVKFRGHNSFSGGLYLVQGRVQFAGGELAATGGTLNPDGGGTGPIYVFPGAYLFPSSAQGRITNAVVIAGNGTAQEQLGAIRMNAGVDFAGPIMLAGDASVGGLAGLISGPVSGPYALAIGSPAVINGTIMLSNSLNSWTGNTVIQARNNFGANTFVSGLDEVIPNGPGKGNVLMRSFSTGRALWNLNGHSETINGLSSPGLTTNVNCLISNGVAATTSLFTLGDNDASGIFGGTIHDGSGVVALTKIGAGTQTLAGPCLYSGPTLVNGGTLVLAGPAVNLASTQIVVAAGAVLDVTGGFSGTLTLTDSQTLSGNGVVIGNVAVNSNAVVSPGASIGVLTIDGDLALNGTAHLELDKTAGTNDQIVASNITYGGVLDLSTLSGALTSTDSFKLFNAATYSGSFAAIQPATPGPGMVWDTSMLAVNGTLGIFGPPVIVVGPQSQTVEVGSNVTFSVTVAGTPPFAYQWNQTPIFLPAPFGTNSTFTVTPEFFDNGQSIWVVVSNAFGSVTSAPAVLTVVDTIPPTILNCASNRTLIADGLCQATLPDLRAELHVSDNASPGFIFITQTPPAGTVLNVGSTQVVFTVTDQSSNSSMCEALVTVVDTAPPLVLFSSNSVTLAFNTNCEALLPDLTTTNFILAIDTCSSVTVTQAVPVNTAMTLGTNFVSVTAFDTSGNSTSRVLTVVVPQTPAVVTQPSGLTVSPGGNALLSVAACGAPELRYQWQFNSTDIVDATNAVVAINNAQTADAGQYRVVITNGFGAVTSEVATLSVYFTTPAPAFAAAGLFSDTNHGVSPESAGLFTLQTTRKQKFTGKIYLDGDVIPFEGSFDVTGAGTGQTAARRGKPALVLTLQFALDGSDRVTGVVSNSSGAWVADLLGDRSPFDKRDHPATLLAGRYTMVLPGANDATVSPAGDGYGLITVGLDGRVSVAGALGDGVSLNAAPAGLSKDGHWPFYSPAGAGNGSHGVILGWLTFAVAPGANPVGTLEWVRAAGGNGIYSGGFAMEVTVEGSSYAPPPSHTAALSLQSGTLVVHGGNLADFAAPYTLDDANEFHFSSPANSIRLSLDPATGQLKGSMASPANPNARVQIRGAALQNDSTGGAFFLGTDQSGSVRLEP